MRNAAHANGPIRKLVNKSTAVFAVDLRGLGETRDQGSNTKYHSHSHRVGNVATHIGQPLLGQRVRDLLSVVDYLNQVGSERVRSIRVIGVGSAGSVALHAAALDARISKVELRNPAMNSWVDDAVAQPLRREIVDHVVPGALAWYDLPDLARQLGARLRTR
jgi:cephalosporin-C deacetylase-like acetyl esterase